MVMLLLIAVIGLFLAGSNTYNGLTGGQTLDLPAPPATPGMEEPPAIVPTTTPTTTTPTPTSTVTPPVVERPVAVPTQPVVTSGDVESRLAQLESRASADSDFSARLDALQSQVDGLKVDVTNLNNRPSVEVPFFDDLKATKRNTVLSILLSVFALILVAGFITFGIFQRRKAENEDKQKLRQYLSSYQNAGYNLDTLKEHLSSSGWNEGLIDEVIREMPR